LLSAGWSTFSSTPSACESGHLGLGFCSSIFRVRAAAI